jgi:DNA-binding transcriptional MerR regulator
VAASTGTPARGDRPSGERSSGGGAPGGGAPEPELLKIGELAERAGVSPGTVRHYLREGLLPKPVKTSRNMAYYPVDYVERIALIRRLQEERFMPQRVQALIESEDRILERALASAEQRGGGRRAPAREIRERYDIPQNVLARLVEIGVLTPSSRGYGPDDVQIVEAISRFRAGGYDEALGFTVYDTLRYREALEPLVQEEIRALLDRLAGEVEVERAQEIIEAGAEPLHELIGAIHSKLLLAELARQRGR